MFDRVLVERFAPEVKTKSGLMIPEKAQEKVLQATVVATGNGRKNEVQISSLISDRFEEIFICCC